MQINYFVFREPKWMSLSFLNLCENCLLQLRWGILAGLGRNIAMDAFKRIKETCYSHLFSQDNHK